MWIDTEQRLPMADRQACQFHQGRKPVVKLF